jgi:pimeloyl-ACP methyl ester carboxylesterase
MIRHGFMHANGLRFHYAAAGDPAAPLILFLHGFPDYWAGWRVVMERLADRFHCVAPDQRGYNLSDKPSDLADYRAKHMIEDARQIGLHFSGGKPFRLAAHDWGGAIGWALALKHPDILVRLAICNAVHPGVFQRELAQNPAQRAASQYINRHREPDAEARIIANDFADLATAFADLVARGVMSADVMAEYRTAWGRPGALTGMLNWYRAMKIETPRPDPDESAADTQPYDPATLRIQVPTLVIWGLLDHALLPGCVEGLDVFVPDLSIEKVPNAGHFITLERPELVADRIGAFMAMGP